MTVSIVIPAIGRSEHQWRTRLVLESLIAQSVKPLEISIVDGEGICNGMANVVDEFADRLPVHFRKLEPSPRSFRAAGNRNAGVEALTCKPDRILFIDGDCVAMPELVETHAGFHENHIVAASRVHVDPNNLNMDALTLQSVFDAENTPDKRQQHPQNWQNQECCYTCNLSIGFDLFEKIGGFWDRVCLSEDREMAMRAMRAGGEVIFLTDPTVYHLDHPVWRPTHRDMLLKGEVTYKDSVRIPGYLRSACDLDKIDIGTVC